MEIASKVNPPLRTLLGPGPSPVNPRVLQSLSLPVIGHLDPVFLRIMADPALLADATKNKLEITPVSGEELTKIAKEVIEQPPEVVERIKKILAQ